MHSLNDGIGIHIHIHGLLSEYAANMANCDIQSHRNPGAMFPSLPIT